jgi:hypothetical protein
MTSDDLHRLRQLRDDLEWLENHAKTERHSPYNHSVETIAGTRKVVGSMIGNLTGWDRSFWHEQETLV